MVSPGKPTRSEFILGVRIDDLSLPDLLSNITAIIHEGRKSIIANVNIYALNIAFENSWFRRFLVESEIVFCDGFGVKFGAFILGKKIIHRYTPPDFIDKVCGIASANDFRLFFLGAREGIAEKAASLLLAKYPRVQIKAHHGFFNKNNDSPENQEIIKMINSFGTNILVVGMGMPLQEQWILENRERLEVNIAFPAGALFDYLSGEQRRAPRWMTDHGLEWLGRLIFEPRRLWKRYIIGNPLFLWRIFKYKVFKLPLPE